MAGFGSSVFFCAVARTFKLHFCGKGHRSICQRMCILMWVPPPRHTSYLRLSSDTQVKKLQLKLIPEREYLFTHKRKRTFRAVFKRIVRAPSTDAMDEYYYQCEVDSILSGNPWSRMHDRVSVLLRPSLITVIQNVPTDPRSIHQYMALGQGKQLVQTEDKWVAEYVHRIRCVFWDLRRTWSKYQRQLLR